MRMLRGLVFSLLGLGILAACGAGADVEQDHDEGPAQEAEQALCSGTPPSTGCDAPPQQVPDGAVCELPSGFDFQYYCGTKGSTGCTVFNCSADGKSWYYAKTGPGCEDIVELYCY